MAIQFAPATKKRAKARVALEGPSGSGKTYTALRLATGLGERIALLDTEHGSASKYADLFTFDTLAISAYDPKTLIEALAAAGAGGYDVFVVDSLSHFWMGIDGMLEQVDRAAKRSAGGNTFGGWKEVTPVERRMLDAMLAFPGHLIVTMRTKTEWVIEENDRGKKVPRKLGMKAVQRDGIEYEFDIVGDLDQENNLVISKSRCASLSGSVIRQPDEELGRTIRAWLDDGVEGGPSGTQLRDAALAPGISRDELRALYGRAQKAGILGAPVVDADGNATTLGELITELGRRAATTPAEDPRRKRMFALFNQTDFGEREHRLAFIAEVVGREVESTNALTPAEVEQVITRLESWLAQQEPAGATA